MSPENCNCFQKWRDKIIHEFLGQCGLPDCLIGELLADAVERELKGSLIKKHLHDFNYSKLMS